MTSESENVCATPGCGGRASMRCPRCIQAGLREGGFFCSQNCFSGFWKEHKAVHAKKTAVTGETVEPRGQGEQCELIWPGFQFSGTLRPYKQSPKRILPENIQRPDYADNGVPESERTARGSNTIIVLTDKEQEKMRKVCAMAREVLDEAVKVAKVGVTTDYIDQVVHEACIARQCYPSPLNYYNFPKSCCTSINEVICHGIPDSRPLHDGDILNIDITVYHDGFHGDLNETIFIGNVSDENKKLVRVAYECLEKAIEMVKPGTRYRDLGDIITKHASANNYSVVRTYCGHGIHRLFHCAPNVPHYSKNKAIGIMKPGHVFTIEPMINAGVWRDCSWPDNWTAVTVDGKRSAQFEQTFLVTESGCEILTGRHSHKCRPYFMDQELEDKSRKNDYKSQKTTGDNA